MEVGVRDPVGDPPEHVHLRSANQDWDISKGYWPLPQTIKAIAILLFD